VGGEDRQVDTLHEFRRVQVDRDQPPGAAGRPVGPLTRAALAGPDRLGHQESRLGQRAYVTQRGRRGHAQPVGDLLVGERLVQAQPEYPPAGRMRQGFQLLDRGLPFRPGGTVPPDPRGMSGSGWHTHTVTA